MFDFKFSPESILPLWSKLSWTGAGKIVFSKIVGWVIPYTGSISPRVDVLSSGHAEIVLKDVRAVRNHLDCVHAIALANLGEFATGLSVVTKLPPAARAILKSIDVEYLKKARGTLRAIADFSENIFSEGSEIVQKSVEVTGNIFDSSGECVSKVKAVWVVGPRK
jgi:acyl-coenzyme A thioesterase PaaI-like protein